MNTADEALQAAKDIVRLEAELEAAKRRFYSHFGCHLDSSTPMSLAPLAAKPGARMGKAPNPASLNQKVLALFGLGPLTIESMAAELGETPNRIRYAVVYHQKKGRIVHADKANTYQLAGTTNGNAVRDEQNELKD